jgi:hypothetical protein
MRYNPLPQITFIRVACSVTPPAVVLFQLALPVVVRKLPQQPWILLTDVNDSSSQGIAERCRCLRTGERHCHLRDRHPFRDDKARRLSLRSLQCSFYPHSLEFTGTRSVPSVRYDHAPHLRRVGDWLHDLSKYFGALILVQRFTSLPSTPFGIGRFALEQNGLAWLHSRGDKVSPRS